jgi:hypothetical protein
VSERSHRERKNRCRGISPASRGRQGRFARFEADHLLRKPLEHLEAAVFEAEWVERSKLDVIERLSARKPTGLSIGRVYRDKSAESV